MIGADRNVVVRKNTRPVGFYVSVDDITCLKIERNQFSVYTCHQNFIRHKLGITCSRPIESEYKFRFCFFFVSAAGQYQDSG
jgi:hypothetical protein